MQQMPIWAEQQASPTTQAMLAGAIKTWVGAESRIQVSDRGGILRTLDFGVHVLPRAPRGCTLRDVHSQLHDLALYLPCTIAIQKDAIVAG